MAVRDDFAAGEVLAAADLNDTFASKLPYSYGTATPSTSVDGFLWYDENDTPPTPKFWDGAAFQNVAPAGGLRLISAETFSAVSSLSVNNCFSSTYLNYLIVSNVTSMTSGATLRLRYRVSSTDASGASDYEWGYAYVDTGAQGFDAGSASDSAITIAVTGSADRMHSLLNIFSPNVATPTVSLHDSWTGSTIPIKRHGPGIHNLSTAYTGFTIFPSTGTITGTIRVYGYRD